MKRVLPYQILVFITWKQVKSSYNNNKFKISTPTWNDKFELPDGSYYVSDTQDCFEYILKKHRESIDNPSIGVHVNKIENRKLHLKLKLDIILTF